MSRRVYGFDGNIYETDIRGSVVTDGKITGEIGFIKDLPKNRSILYVGNITIYNTKHFNWLNKIMFKIFFGIKIEDYKEEE